MSVRRLAPAQPESFIWAPDSVMKVEFWLGKYPADRKRSAVIPLLWLAQKQEGWVSEPAMRLIADQLEMPYIRVYEVATFYTMFNLAPVGRHHVQLCGTTPCALRGAEELKRVCEQRIGKQMAVTPDGALSWLEVECLGACVNAPMVQISSTESDHYYEDLTPAVFETLLDDLAAGREARPGSQVGRDTSAPAGGQTTLTDLGLYDGARGRPMTKLPNTGEPA
ncbi:MAG: NADH-quinone oxidoreductase subunit NuoE [Caulobacterales bacterium]|nr:NADH-quinone oxidoreductase subunit NuoE [Caulobacterales bacterium]